MARRDHHLRHPAVGRGVFLRQRRDQARRIEPVFSVDDHRRAIHRLAGVPGPGVELALGIEHHERPLVGQDVRDHEAGRLVARRLRGDEHVAVPVLRAHRDQLPAALPAPRPLAVRLEVPALAHRVREFAEHDPAVSAEPLRDLAAARPGGVRKRLAPVARRQHVRARAAEGLRGTEPEAPEGHRRDHQHRDEGPEAVEDEGPRRVPVQDDRLRPLPGMGKDPERLPVALPVRPRIRRVERDARHPQQPPARAARAGMACRAVRDCRRNDAECRERRVVPLPLDPLRLVQLEQHGKRAHVQQGHHRKDPRDQEGPLQARPLDVRHHRSNPPCPCTSTVRPVSA